jgi:tetratricopeptide (TPR) repeat protein
MVIEIRQFNIPILLAALLAGCSTATRVPGPGHPSGAPVDAPAAELQPADDRGRRIRVRAYDPSTRVAVRAEHGQAVNSLLERSRRQEAAGELAAAAGTLERALRIEPRNARLWHRLAALRYRQSRYVMAQDLATRSNSLAADDRELKRVNWRLIAAARRAQGDETGAREAERRVREI